MTRAARRMRRRWPIAAVAVIAVGGAGWATYAAAAGDPHDYRLATAAVGNVSATLDLSGTVSASGRADLTAGASGKVVAVPVHVGQHVRRNQVIARLDQTSLQAQVLSARAQLAKAKAQLSSDEAAQLSGVTSAAGSSTTTTSSSGTGSTGSDGVQNAARITTKVTTKVTKPNASSTGSASLAKLQADQKAVTTAQTAASDALATASSALDAEKAACADTSQTASTGATDTATDGATDGATPSSTATSGQLSQDCQDALGAVESAQAAVATAQDDLRKALDTLTTDLAAAVKASTSGSADANPGGSTGTPGGQSGLPSSQSGAPSGGAAKSGASGGVSVTAATLARDQASIDQANADLISALQSRAAAVVRAPAAGQVRSLGVSVGDQASAGDDVAVIVGKGLTTVDIDASESQVRQLEVGQTASVVPAGASAPIEGTVSRIAHIPTSSSSALGSSSDSSYAVVVTLAAKGSQPALGMPVGVSVLIGTAKDVVTIPASAVSDGTVEVYAKGEATATRVTTGVVGTNTIQVVSGLKAGQQVVLADLDEDVPTSGSSSSRTRGFGSSGGLGGLSGGGAGIAVGGPPGGFGG